MITAVMIGAGNRGTGVYGRFAQLHPHLIRFVAVADPDPKRRAHFAGLHRIPKSRQYANDIALLKEEKLADACFICTQDQDHIQPATQSLHLGYHVFLEKPMATNPIDVFRLGQIAKNSSQILGIGHVLRYTNFFKTIKKAILAGKLGEIVSIQHNENVGYYHHAHSYVRGNWRKESLSSPMILAKSCHDLDILTWLTDTKVKSLSSFGSLKHFTIANLPKGAPDYCLDGCAHKNNCPFYAPRIYLAKEDWLNNSIAVDAKSERILKALLTSPYGRCVYKCDNDVVDHQVVAMELENHVTVAFTMSAFTQKISRNIKIMGTKAELFGNMENNKVILRDFLTNSSTTIQITTEKSGHGGGDFGIMHAFVQAIANNETFDANAEGAVQSHLLAFAAEKSRREKCVVEMDSFIEEVSRC